MPTRLILLLAASAVLTPTLASAADDPVSVDLDADLLIVSRAPGTPVAKPVRVEEAAPSREAPQPEPSRRSENVVRKAAVRGA